MMKMTLMLVLMSSLTMAAKKSEWMPKYKNLNKKQIEKNVLNSTKKKPLSGKDVVSKKSPLEALYLKAAKKKSDLVKLKNETMKLKQKAVPLLLKVMKDKKFPNESRWVATYMLGRIMGKKSAPLISKYAQHPNWMLRLASLKVLLHLDQKQYKGVYARLLEDKSLIVRHQALQNIKKMKLKELAPYVWKMLYNKKNYVGLKGHRKRSHIIKDAIKIVGDLGFMKARASMLKMFKKNKYRDVFKELDYSLSKLSSTASPKGPMSVKKQFWNQTAAKEITI